MKYVYFAFLTFLIFSAQLNAQTVIDFETANDGYTATGAYGSGYTDLFNRTNANLPVTNSEDGYYWGAEDMSGGTRRIDLDQIDVSGSSDFTFSLDMLAHHYEDWDATDQLLITYSLDGGAYQNLMWVQMVPGDNFNGPAALDLGFDGNGDCGATTTLPALTKGTQHGCTVSSSDFATFSTSPITLANNTTLDIRLDFINLTSNDEGIYIDNITITETGGGPANTEAEFTSSSDNVMENAGSFNLPISISNPATSATTTVSIELTSGDASLTDDFPSVGSTINVVIPANTSSYNYSLDINDNSVCGANGDLEFEISSVSGGQGTATVGAQNTFTLTVDDDEGTSGAIATQNFDGTSPVWTISSGSGTTGPSYGNTGDGRRIGGSQSFNLSTVNTSGYTNLKIELKTASVGGIENADALEIYVNTGSGYPSTPDIKIQEGNTSDFSYNKSWTYSASGIASTTAGIPASFNGDGSGGYSNVEIDIPNGTNSVSLRIEANNNNSNEYYYIDDIVLSGESCPVTEPEILVEGNGNEIVNGDVSPTTSDDTDFGNILISSGNNPNTFTVSNTGSADLNISSVTSSNATEFAISGISIPATITPGNSTTFVVTFDPTAIGNRTSTITINNNDSDEDPSTFAVQGEGTAIPDISLSSTNPAVAVGNILQGVDNHIIYAYELAVTNFDAEFTAFSFSSSGSYAASNITNFKAWYSIDATFNASNDIQLGNQLSSSLGPGSHTFNGFTQSISEGSTGYIFVTADLPCSSTDGNTIQVQAISTNDLTFTSGNKSGTAFTGGLQTITSETPNNISNLSTSNCVNGGVTLSWDDATGCNDNYMVVASLSSLTAAPSGNGIAYTPNTNYGDGTAYDDGFVVYEASGTSVSINGLTNGTNYTFTVFTRNDLNWSSGVEANCTPGISIPDNGCSSNNYATDTISYTGSSGNIDDINVGVSITHTYKSDLYIEVESPEGTIVALYDGINGGSGENIDVWFDDASSNTLSSSNHTIDGSYDQTIGSEIDPLSDFNNENPNGNWIIRICDAAAADEGTLDDWEIDITEACIPSQSISSFTPTSGPFGTRVTINGSGFSPSSSVAFNGTAASEVEFVSSTKIIAQVASGTTTGKIELTESGCTLNSNTDFNILNDFGTCSNSSSGSFTDLIISEVYDAGTGSYHYVELYNPTSSSINLSNYEVEVTAGGSVQSPRLDPTGTIASGEFYIIAFGSNSGFPCSITADLTNTTNTNLGFNENGSAIGLFKNNSLLDYVDLDAEVNTSSPGFSVYRNPSSNGPSTTYNSADWNNDLIETCDSLGQFEDSANPPSIVNNPVDYNNCGDIDLTATAAEGDGNTTGDLTFQWYYTDGSSNGWSPVNDTNLPGFLTDGQTENLYIIEDGGDLSTLTNYQFYLEVTEAGTCGTVSYAVEFTYEVQPYFRTKNGVIGYWDEVNNWEMSLDEINWSNACEVPNANNAISTHISNNSYISVRDGIGAPDLLIDSLVIDEGGILEIEPTAELELENRTGVDLTVNGTLIDRSNNGAGNGISFLNNATWIIYADDTIQFTSNGSKTAYRDQYEGGISSIPASAHWFYTHDPSDGNIVSTLAVDMYYPNLYFESTDVNGHDFSSFSEIFAGQSGHTTIKGDLNIGISNQSNTITVLNNNFNVQALIVEGDLYLGAQSVLSNETYRSFAGQAENGNYNVQYREGTGIELRGSAIIDGILDMSHNNTGQVEFTGGQTQDVSGNDTIRTWNMLLNKASNAELELSMPLKIFNDFELTDGELEIQNSSASIEIGGDWINTNAEFEHGNSKVIFNGSSDASIRSNLQSFYQIDVQNSNSSLLYPTADYLEIEDMLEIFPQGHFQIPATIETNCKQIEISNSGILTIKSDAVLRVNP